MYTRLTSLALLITLLFSQSVSAQEAAPEGEFTSPTIAIGCVVSDIDASVKFYTEAIGFKDARGFKVAAGFATETGLTDQKPLDIKALTLGDGPGATELKLMQVDGGSAKPANDHINTSLGFSYLTIFVKSTDAALARLKKQGVKTIGKEPVALATNPNLVLMIVRDPDGNFVELIGPPPTK